MISFDILVITPLVVNTSVRCWLQKKQSTAGSPTTCLLHWSGTVLVAGLRMFLWEVATHVPFVTAASPRAQEIQPTARPTPPRASSFLSSVWVKISHAASRGPLRLWNAGAGTTWVRVYLQRAKLCTQASGLGKTMHVVFPMALRFAGAGIVVGRLHLPPDHRTTTSSRWHLELFTLVPCGHPEKLCVGLQVFLRLTFQWAMPPSPRYQQARNTHAAFAERTTK